MTTSAASPSRLFVPIYEITAELFISLDGVRLPARRGETVMAVLLRNGAALGRSEFDGRSRAGFCLMGACQDCSLWGEGGGRVRACMTMAEDGMALVTAPPLSET
ncbi:putative molibdopterin-dependent oxidoreductase YjgC [Rhodopseudomonas julia]|uniref:Molibdopterin-dependent oxidoreductase YjgC n=1 Tax=Rhodopseudomonas julia TaxID=200617 RepID=A0ABU0C2C0_9BRAD|nr:(2Fe-2S)-binding protein [Rhodopseudomonas julia]MDQ0324658.1 putative molibdopterin-dependent oxidoreductase YjgC [Rhodopseudomonas julia]